VSNAPADPANFCYRHPDRQSFVLCQRCGRTICPECQTQAAVGVHCPECVKEARASVPRTRPALMTSLRRARSSDTPVATWSIIGLTVFVYILQWVTGGAATQYLLFYADFVPSEPWRMVTPALVHSTGSIFHILFNMYSLFVFGPILERMLGRWRFLGLYVLADVGGQLAVLFIAPDTPVIGASGAIFGLLGAFFVVQRRLGGNNLQLIIVIGLNLVIGFIVPGIAWQAHVGGLLAGALVAFVFLMTRERSKRQLQVLLIAAIVVAFAVLTVLGVAIAAARG
jgi:membrane associated rhomboid family serine protease